MTSAQRRIALAVTIAAAALLLLFWRRSPDPPDSGSVVAQVRHLHQLTTVRYTIQRVVDLEERKQPLGSERILLILQARVEAGVNLQSLTESDVGRRPDGSLWIRMPPAEIVNVAVDEKQTRVWDRRKTWWMPWIPYSNELETRARMEGLDAARKAAIEMGILRQADAGAEQAVRGFLALVGIADVAIVPPQS